MVHRLALSLVALALAGCIAEPGDDGVVTKPETVELGILTCELEAVDNLLVYARESFLCAFEGSGRSSEYSGRIDKVGANLEIKGNQNLAWAVLAPARYDQAGSLAGSYVGASAEIAALYGAGAKILIGGSDNAIVLQPVSISTTTDSVGLSLTIDALKLTYDGPA